MLAIVLSEAATRLLWREMYYTLTRRTLLDFISATEACFISWEIITIFIFYGKSAFTIFCFANLCAKLIKIMHVIVFDRTKREILLREPAACWLSCYSSWKLAALLRCRNLLYFKAGQRSRRQNLGIVSISTRERDRYASHLLAQVGCQITKGGEHEFVLE